MNTRNSRILRSTANAWALAVLGATSLAVLSGCWDSNPCDPGEIIIANMCHAAPPDAGNSTTAGSGSGGSGGSGGGAATGGKPPADAFSYKMCATDADCGGQTPTCTTTAPPPSKTLYCTSSPCETGAADTCPKGGYCSDKFASFGAPNFCAKD